MPFLTGAAAAIIIGASTRGNLLATVASGLFAAAATYLFLPVLAANFAGIWLLTAATFAIGGGVALRTSHAGGRRRAAGLTVAAAPVVLAVLTLVSFVSTASLFHAAAYATLLDGSRPSRSPRPSSGSTRPGIRPPTAQCSTSRRCAWSMPRSRNAVPRNSLAPMPNSVEPTRWG